MRVRELQKITRRHLRCLLPAVSAAVRICWLKKHSSRSNAADACVKLIVVGECTKKRGTIRAIHCGWLILEKQAYALLFMVEPQDRCIAQKPPQARCG